MIKIIEFVFLGILQGFTEPIPVSSSGHILIFQTIFEKFNQNINIDFSLLATLTNFGSLIAILLFFRKDIINLFRAFFTYIFNKDKREKNKDDYKYCWLVVLATIPAGIAGIIVTKLELLDFLEENVRFVGLMLIVTAFFLFLIKDFKGIKSNKNITFKDAIIIGFAQMIALIPGISRSGATIVGGMFRGLKREVAFKFSFILYIPISIATGILGIKDLIELSISKTECLYYLLATLLAGILTYIATKWFNRVVKEGKFIYFSIYCLIAGLLVIIFL
ncbi:MAG TPA: undecaprenyl-diphosphate phosphatase [Bacilli bacterium]|nr:undecaprenyl-diphosphate phosphatase [Bacilli bacterium]